MTSLGARPNKVHQVSLGVMQPYLFPYVGYFQLIHAVDCFVIYDDVNYIKQGWVNRNRILLNGEPHLFTLPVKNASSFSPINTVELDGKNVIAWSGKFLKTIGQAYARAPFLPAVLDLLHDVLTSPHADLAKLLEAGICAVSGYIGIRTPMVSVTHIPHDRELSGQSRIIAICQQERVNRYVNAIGGKALYDHAAFEEHGIQLSFLRSRLPAYRQFGAPFVPGLSIIDAMMFLPPEALLQMMAAYDLE